ncbi:right-handed parallel beta-helix repeat-containing protein [Salinirubellus sp. GCM10025818]|uniref:right-handed parallel beta-helix repeat-containing protein n=1 Tax=Salinirubellus TaxID=2162630 RepID=UPI0030D23F07
MDTVASWRGVLAALLAAFVVVGTGAAGVVGVAGVASAGQAGTTLYVDDGSAAEGDEFCAPGSANATRYQEIQTAVVNASEGDTVRVCDGTYSAFVVNEQLTVVGAGGVVDLEGAPGPAVFVEVDANGAVVRGLPVRNAGVGVFARGATDVTVADASFEGIDERAVELSGTEGTTLRNITVNESAVGVRVEDSPGVSVESSTFRNLTGRAVDLEDADGATVSGLSATDVSAGVSVQSSADVTVADSTFERVGESAVTLRNSGDATISGLDVTNGSTGVEVLAAGGEEVPDVALRDVTVRNLTDGLRAGVSEGATLSGLALSDLDVAGTDRGVDLSASGSGSVLANVTVEGSTVVDSAERGVGVSTLDGTARVRSVVLEGLTVEGPGSGEGVSVSAQAGEIRDVTLENSSVASHEVGVSVSNDDAVLSNATAFRNRITDNTVGVEIDEGSPRSNTEDVAVRQNLVSDSTDEGVLVGDDTDVDGVRVTRNVIRGNGFGVRNEGDGVLAAWLNYWGVDSGPSTPTGVADPVTDTSADGDGDAVSSAVRFDPWLGKGTCPAPGVRSVVDGPFELYEVSIGLGELQSFCAWDLAPLSLRPDPADAATNVGNLNVSYELEGTDGPVPGDRRNVTIYEAGESFDLQFGAGSTDTGAFAGNEMQLIVLRDPGSAAPSFEFGFDHREGETILRSDAESAEVRTDWGTLDGDGQVSESFEPPAAGTYTFVLVEREFGSGLEEGTPREEVRVDGGVTVLGFETVAVRSTGADAAVNDTNASDAGLPAGSDVPLELSSNLGSSSTEHAVLLYDESRFRNASMTVSVDATAADVLAGEFDPEGDVTVRSSVEDLNGFYRAAVGFSALGVDVPVTDDSGRVDPSPVLGLGTRLYDTTGASRTTASGATLLNGSVIVRTSSDSSTAIEAETFRNFSTGTYRYVYLARQGRATSSDTGTVELTEPAETPTPTATPEDDDDDDGGGGGGGQVGGIPGEVEVEATELLNGTVTTEEPVVVRFDLFNPDPAGGPIDLSIEADGETVAEDTVRVPASSRRTVFLRTTIGTPGTYELTAANRSLGSLTVTEAATATPVPTETGTPTPTPSPANPGTAPATATPAGDEAMGSDPGESVEAPAGGPGPATETETVVALGMALLLLYGVGVAVYVLRENPPSRLG